ncbi:TMEM220 protein [Trinorchestia longiramus]|nr:TMEM220 protein [Trinorchestia longiramus]
MKRHLDLEQLERARRGSVDSGEFDSQENFFEDYWLPVSAEQDSFPGTPEKILISSIKHMGHSKSMDRYDACNKFLEWKIRFLHIIMAGVLAYVGVQQIERHDAAVWIPLFLVPAGITLLSTIDVRYLEGVCMKSVVSVYLGSAICLMIWLATSLLVTMTQKTTISSYSPLDYQQGREMMAVTVCIAWQKFHLFTIKEQAKANNLRKSYGRPSAASAPREVLKRVVPLVLLPGALAAFCYIESIKPMLISTSSALQKIIM